MAGIKSYCFGCGHPLPWGATCEVCPKVGTDANLAVLAQAVVDRDATIARLTRERDELAEEVVGLRVTASTALAQEATLRRERDEARADVERAKADERARAVAWLRAEWDKSPSGQFNEGANAIEAGEHDRE